MERTLKSRLHSDRGNRNAHVRASSINHLDRLAINYRDHANQQVREADGFPDMRISKSGKLTVSLTCESASPGSRRLPRHANQQVREERVSRKIWMRIQKNLDSAVNPARRLTFDSSLSHSFLLLQRNCGSVGTARAL